MDTPVDRLVTREQYANIFTRALHAARSRGRVRVLLIDAFQRRVTLLTVPVCMNLAGDSKYIGPCQEDAGTILKTSVLKPYVPLSERLVRVTTQYASVVWHFQSHAIPKPRIPGAILSHLPGIAHEKLLFIGSILLVKIQVNLKAFTSFLLASVEGLVEVIWLSAAGGQDH